MWTFYIANRAAWQKHIGRFQSHCTDHEGGVIVLIAKFKLPEHQDAFEAEPGVTPFPRLNSMAPIGATLAATLNGFSALASLGILPTDSTFDCGMKLRKHHAGFDPRKE